MVSLFHFTSLIAAFLIVLSSFLTLILYFRNKKSSLLYSFLFILPFGVHPFRYLLSIPFTDIHIFMLGKNPENIFLFAVTSILLVYSSLQLLDLFRLNFISISLGLLVFSSIALKILSKTEIMQIPDLFFGVGKFVVVSILFILFLISIKRFWIPESKVLGYGFISLNIIFLVIFLFDLFFGAYFHSELGKWLSILDSLYGIVLSLIFIIYTIMHFYFKPEEESNHNERESSFKEDFNITEREWEIICYICNGYTSKDISRIVQISQQTVKNHCNNIYRKLSINSKIELVNMVHLNRI